jgi:hypothetical protein
MHVHESKRRREDERAAAVKSAGPSPHALLALQRSAGNQAVSAVIARVIKPKQIRKEIKEAIAAGNRTKDAVLLSIYNEMRFTMDPVPGQFRQVAAATKALIEAGRMVQEDADNYAAEAELQVKGGGRPVSAADRLKAEVEADRKDMDQALFDHVLKGGKSTEKRPTGYHTTQGGSTTHQAFGDKTDGEGGIYQRSVRFTEDPLNIKPTQSTFFPDTADGEAVKNAITSVYGKHGKALGVQSVRYPEALKGVKMTQRDGTAFPFTTPPLPGEDYDSTYVKQKK